MTKILAEHAKIGQMVFWHKRAAVITFKSGNSKTVEVTFVRGSTDRDDAQDTREIGYAEMLVLLDADFYYDEECIYRTFAVQEQVEAQAALKETVIEAKMKQHKEAQENQDRLRDLADIFSPNKNPFLKAQPGFDPFNKTTQDFLKHMETMTRKHSAWVKPAEDDDGS